MKLYNVVIHSILPNKSFLFKKLLRDDFNYSIKQILNVKLPLELNYIKESNINRIFDKLSNLTTYSYEYMEPIIPTNYSIEEYENYIKSKVKFNNLDDKTKYISEILIKLAKKFYDNL